MRIRFALIWVVLLLVSLLLIGCDDRPESTPTEAPIETTEAPNSAQEPPVAQHSDPEEAPSSEQAPPAAQHDDPEVVAYVNGRPVYADDFEVAKASVTSQYAQMYAQFGMSIDTMMVGADGKMFQLSLEARALDRAMASVLVEEEAERRALEPTDQEVEATFEEQYTLFLADQGWTQDDFAAYLVEQGTSLEDFRTTGLSSIAWQLTLEAVRKAVTGPIEISDDDLATYFTEHNAEYSQPAQVRASHILVETEQEAEEILAELAAGADFADLARERSTCSSASAGGDLDWFSTGMMVPPFEEAAFALAVGETSDIVQSDFGFHIIRLTDRKDALEPALEDVIEQVRADLEETLLNEGMQTWFNGVYDSAKFEILLPLVAAARAQEESIDLGIEAFERVREEGTVNEPYLPYIIGTLYEAKLGTAQSQRDALEADADDTPERTAEIAALDTEILDYRNQALIEYRRALEAVGEDPTIQARIDGLEGEQSADAEPSPES